MHEAISTDYFVSYNSKLAEHQSLPEELATYHIYKDVKIESLCKGFIFISTMDQISTTSMSRRVRAFGGLKAPADAIHDQGATSLPFFSSSPPRYMQQALHSSLLVHHSTHKSHIKLNCFLTRDTSSPPPLSATPSGGMGLEFELPSEQLQLSDQVPILKLLLKQLAVSQASIAVDGATSAVKKLPFELHRRTMRLNFRLFFTTDIRLRDQSPLDSLGRVWMWFLFF